MAKVERRGVLRTSPIGGSRKPATQLKKMPASLSISNPRLGILPCSYLYIPVVVAIAETLLIVGCAVQAQSAPNIMQGEKIVFVLTDDQAVDTLSHMPNVQSLLNQQGRTFTNAFNAYPLCCSSPDIMQRGEYAQHQHLRQLTRIPGSTDVMVRKRTWTLVAQVTSLFFA
jgi:hypothetical protein